MLRKNWRSEVAFLRKMATKLIKASELPAVECKLELSVIADLLRQRAESIQSLTTKNV